jgi:Periplasmic protease
VKGSPYVWLMLPHLARSRLSLIVLIGLLAAGCQSSPPQPLTVAAEEAPAGQRVASLLARDSRVNAMAFRLMTANLDLCPHARPIAGWVLHAASLYDGEQRQAVMASHDLQSDLPGIIGVAPDSPAERAGLRAGDLIVAVNGQDLQPGTLQAAAAYAGFAAHTAALEAALDLRGPVLLTIRRDGQRQDVSLSPVMACAYQTQVRPSPELQARADGAIAELTSAMVDYLDRDEDLAVVLGHEQAHNLLQHQPGGRRLPTREGGLARTSARMDREAEADRLGLFLAARAGFDIRGAPALVQRWERDFPNQAMPGSGSSGTSRRVRAMQGTVDEIEALRQGHRPLQP